MNLSDRFADQDINNVHAVVDTDRKRVENVKFGARFGVLTGHGAQAIGLSNLKLSTAVERALGCYQFKFDVDILNVAEARLSPPKSWSFGILKVERRSSGA